MSVKITTRCHVALPVRKGQRMLMRETEVARYGEYWAITTDDAHRLVHIPTGMEFAPASSGAPWTEARKRRAAKLLAGQGELWNFDHAIAIDRMHPVMIKALEHWQLVEHLVCAPKGR